MAAAARRPAGREPDFEAVSREQLAQLSEDVGGQSLREYVRAFLDLLPGRLERIEQAITTGDSAEAARVMVDLRSSSAILGASRLPTLISALEETVRINPPPRPARLAVVRAEAEAVASELRRLVDGESPGPTDDADRGGGGGGDDAAQDGGVGESS
jgi:HPt (histidine-containing phosphotransfer) domain-containing protein